MVAFDLLRKDLYLMIRVLFLEIGGSGILGEIFSLVVFSGSCQYLVIQGAIPP